YGILFTGLRPPLASAFSIPLRSRPFLYTSIVAQMHSPVSTSGTPRSICEGAGECTSAKIGFRGEPVR
ncbi:MAG: hypothetical protein II684_03030, partial [Treponema sp.]|nr:hypothetical protein [Treponema sp.]